MDALNTHTLSFGIILRFLLIASLLLLLVWYVHFQARNFLNGPSITLEDGNSIVHTEQRLALTGTAQNIVKLTLNGKEIHTNEEGVFTHTLILEQGYTIMTLVAQDRFGREAFIKKEYVYKPS